MFHRHGRGVSRVGSHFLFLVQSANINMIVFFRKLVEDLFHQKIPFLIIALSRGGSGGVSAASHRH